MPVFIELNKSGGTGSAPVKIFTAEVEYQAMSQLKNLARLPIIHSHIAAMPDVHVGIGATVGSVIPTRSAIIPSAVGVDIGCGMNAVRLSLKASQLPDDLSRIRSAIERAVPVGQRAHSSVSSRFAACKTLASGADRLLERHPKLSKMLPRAQQIWVRQLGTLGSGNHFIEVCVDQSQDVWVMLHSGSRGIGNVIGRYFIERARKDMSRHIANLPDRDLAYFEEGSPHFAAYLEAVEWAQEYARVNRQEMLGLTLRAMQPFLPSFTTTCEAINCHHNYVQKERHYGADVYVTRKGAISAREGQLGIIPGSMGARSFIVRGKGNPESFCSCAHGAGRKMSRMQARQRFTREDLERQTAGVECRKDKGVLDEIPSAYKDIDEVMKNQSDLVEVVHELKQLICIKG
ncbi:RtcB family protein [Hahella sp. KA22]|nr:RtcB family protein [Hahella sp. KA22]QAY54450.1 RtcB family protein [Hahella sp. KA22]